MRAEAARQQISGRELARRLEVKPVYISRRLSGEVDMSATDLQKIAEVLEVPVSQFFGENSPRRGARRSGGRAA